MSASRTRPFNALHGVLILGLAALTIKAWVLVAPLIYGAQDRHDGECVYQVIRNNERQGTLFLTTPQTISDILLIAGVPDEIPPGLSCEGTIPCNRVIRIRSNPMEVVVDKIAGPQLLNMGKRVDVNTADESDFSRVPGIGPILAQRIVARRAVLGGFKTLEELKSIQGIREKKFSKISGYLELESEFPYRLQHIKTEGGFLDPSSRVNEQDMSRSQQVPQ